jgi:hypothetical protein
MVSPCAVAVLIGVQKWLRDPASENAKLLTCSPRATASLTSRGPCASSTATAE